MNICKEKETENQQYVLVSQRKSSLSRGFVDIGADVVLDGDLCRISIALIEENRATSVR
jgi:hypothetical protein